MNPRALCLCGALLASPAWSQEAATNAPPLIARAFDLASDSIQRIVHDTAAAQSVPVTISDAKPAQPESGRVVRFAPPEKAPPAEPPLPRPQAKPLSPFLSALVDIAADELLGGNAPTPYERWLANRSRDSFEALRQRAQSPDDYPPSPLRPKP